MSNDVLPFVLVWGPWIWKVGVVVTAGLAVAVVVLVRRRREDRRLRAALAELARSTDAVLGTLRAHDASAVVTTMVGAGAEPAPSTSATGTLYLETERGDVAIDGPVEVVLGSAATLGADGTTQRSVCAGDEVVALGAVEVAPSVDATDYRDNAARSVLRPLGERPITLGARVPARELRQSITGLLAVAALAGGVATCGARSLGSRWLETCGERVPWETTSQHLPPDKPFAVTNTHACSLAAATPGRAEDAMEELLWRLDRVAPSSARTAALAFALSERVESCSAFVGRLLRSDRYAEAARRARACGDRRTEHVALLYDARFEEAIGVPVPEDTERNLARLPTTPTLIAAGRWQEAAADVDARAAAIAGDTDAQLSMMRYRCLAELYRHFGGDAGALARIRAHHASEHGAVCAPMLAEAVGAEERAAVLAGTDDRSHPTDTTAVLAHLRGDDNFLYSTPEKALVQPGDMANSYSIFMSWLVALEQDRWLADPAGRTSGRLRWLAVKRTYDGDIAAARALADEVTRIPIPSLDRYMLRDVPHLRAAIALHTSEVVPVDFAQPLGIDAELLAMVQDNWQHDHGRLLLRAGQPIDKAYFGPRDDYKQALGEASRGDATHLALHIGDSSSWWLAGDILAVLPRVTTGRAELVEAVRHARRSWAGGPDVDIRYPFYLLGGVIERRQLFAIAGLPDEAKRWDDVYRRIDAVLSDRAKLVALMLWHR